MNAPEKLSVPATETRLALDLLYPSPTQPRTHFDQAALEDLAVTIKEHGVLQPILVRGRLEKAPANLTTAALGSWKPRTHEIVCGERRFRASKIAGVADIPVVIRELTDIQVLKIQVIENLQRDDLHPLDEAVGYERLMREPHKLSADTIADEIGKSRRYVFARLQLLELTDHARTIFREGKWLTMSTALVLARVPHDLQAKCLGEMSPGSVNGVLNEPMTYRAALEHVRRNYMLDLDNAPFDIKIVDYRTAKGAPIAGACGPCKKRTGANADLFEDIKGQDMCTDPKCFNAKRDAQAAVDEALRQADVDEETEADRLLKSAKGASSLPGKSADKAGHSTPAAQAPRDSGSAESGQVAAKVKPKDKAAADAAELELTIRSQVFLAAREKMRTRIIECGGLPFREDVRLVADIVFHSVSEEDASDSIFRARNTDYKGIMKVIDSGSMGDVFLLMFEASICDMVDLAPLTEANDLLLQAAKRLGVDVPRIRAVAKDAAIEAAKRAELDAEGFWTIAELEARIPKDGKPNENGVFTEAITFRAVAPGQKGSCEICLVGSKGKYFYGYDNQVKNGGQSSGPSTHQAFASLENALRHFAAWAAGKRRDHDRADKIGMLLDAGLAAKSADHLLPKMFRNLGLSAWRDSEPEKKPKAPAKPAKKGDAGSVKAPATNAKGSEPAGVKK